MKFVYRGNRWLGVIKSDKSVTNHIVKLDSGAQATTLRLSTVSDLVNWTPALLSKYLSGRETVKFAGVNGNTIDLVPCKLTNITVCSDVIPAFYCMVSDRDEVCHDLLGADFIGSFCRSGNYNVDEDFYKHDNSLFKHNFLEICQGVHTMELWSLDSFNSLDLVTKVVSGAIYAPACETWKGQNGYNTDVYEKELRHIVEMCKVTDIGALEEIIRSL